MEDSKALLYHYRIAPDGTASIVDAAAAADADGGLVWMHVNGRHPDAKRVLKETLHVDPLVVRALLAEETRPRLDVSGDKGLIILRGLHYNPGPEPEDLVSVRLWAGQGAVVSVGRRRSHAVEGLDARIRQGAGPRTAGEFVALLVALLGDGIEPAIHELEDATDGLEEKSLEGPEPELRNAIAALRKQAIVFRRHIAPQRDVISRINHALLPWISETDQRALRDSLDRAARTVEDLDAIRERTQIVQDELSSALAAKLNRDIYVLSVITVIFMPLTFLTGLLGANLHGIPGADSPRAFAVFCLGLLAVVAVEVAWLKRVKWL